MNTSKIFGLAALVLLPLVTPAFAHGDHDKPAKVEAKSLVGPNRGKVLTQVEPRAELFVTAGRKVKLTFIDDTGKALPIPAGATASLVTGSRAAPTTLAFASEDGALVSTTALPEGENLPAIVRLQTGTDAKPVTVRVQLNLAKCGECDAPEYACVCH